PDASSRIRRNGSIFLATFKTNNRGPSGISLVKFSRVLGAQSMNQLQRLLFLVISCNGLKSEFGCVVKREATGTSRNWASLLEGEASTPSGSFSLFRSGCASKPSDLPPGALTDDATGQPKLLGFGRFNLPANSLLQHLSS